MFQINLRGEKQGRIFNNVNAAYKWVCQNVMTKEDIDFYKAIGNKTPLYAIQDERVREAVLRNSFEKICFSGWNDKADLNSPYFINHE